MNLILEDKRRRIIRAKEEIKFSTFSSYHLVIVTARAKSEKQLGNQATDDEDLTIKLDNRSFPKPGSSKLIDSPAAFNGGGLHNLSKVIYLLTFLKGENHEIALEADNPPGTATLENLQVYTLHPAKKLFLESNIQAEDGDRRPWISFVLDNVALKSLTTALIYARRKRDCDDVKIIIDGKTQGNLLQVIKHFLWRFVGSLIPWSSPTKTETQIFEMNLPEGRHYFEFDADRKPILEKVVIDFGEELPIPKELPNVDNPKWTGSFYDDTEELLLARATYGEVGGESYEAKVAVAWSIKNRVEDSKQRWGNTYHQIILKPFQYEPFNKPESKAFNKITSPSLGNPIENKAWYESYEAAKNVIAGQATDPTKGANHFYANNSLNVPNWADEDSFTVELGNTRFYKL